MTFFFCQHFLQKGDRTVDQMVQAARSGKQNIIEGCAASATSAKTEIKLVNVAKASLQELLEDYIDYLHTRGHRRWEEGSPEYTAMLVNSDVHSPARIRVMAALPMIDTWYDAFGIKQGDKMFIPKEKRALVW